MVLRSSTGFKITNAGQMGKRMKKKVEVFHEEADVVRRIYSWYLTSSIGGKEIAKRLNEEGYKRRGKTWCANRVIDVLKDKAYCGRYYYNRRDKNKGRLKPQEEWVCIDVEPIISEDDWKKVEIIRKQRNPEKTNPAVTGSKTLLTGIAYCSLCGG